MAKQFSMPAKHARRFADPNFDNIERHVLFVNVRNIPPGIPLDPNARVPNVRKRVYRKVEESLFDIETEPGTFHLKHNGITLIADSVRKRKDAGDVYVIHMEDGHGVLDGGHSYELIRKCIEEHEHELPEKQFVKLEILTGVPEGWVVDIAGGLNTSVQVQDMSLDNLEGLFNWIKDELRGEPYFDTIAWKENEPGMFDARDIVSFMTCFNIDEFPNAGDQQPIMAYEKKSQALKLFETKPDSYERLRPLLRDILTLHDTIRYESRGIWNEAGGQFGKFAFVEQRSRGEYEFPFIGKTLQSRLLNGALYPMLASFRWMVEEDEFDGTIGWRGGFDKVLGRWRASAEELLKATAAANTELGRNPNAIGKSRNHWANLHARVAMRDLMAREVASGPVA